MAMDALHRLCLLVCVLIGAGCSQSPRHQRLPATTTTTAGNVQRRPPGVAGALGSPLIGHDGRLIACSEKKSLVAFERNGSIAWMVTLGHTCKEGISPVAERDEIYLVAEDNKVIKITPKKLHTADPPSEVFFSYNATPGRSEEIIGLSISGSSSSLFLTIRNRGLFAFSLHAELQWSAGPVADLVSRLGCKTNISGCYFNSPPVVDRCEGTLYVSNTEGQLYSLYIKSGQYRWIQDLGSLDKVMNIVPGNNGLLYIVLPRKSIVMGLDVLTGNISWQQTIGPLSNEKILPPVDSNGWISVGSLDGTLYSISPNGDIRRFPERTTPGSVIHASPVLDCSGFSVYVSQTIMEAKSNQTIGDSTSLSVMKSSSTLLTLLTPANGTIHWTGNYPGELSDFLSSTDLNDFALDETIVLRLFSAASKNWQHYAVLHEKYVSFLRTVKPNFGNDQGDRNIRLVLFFHFIVIVIAIVNCFCCIFWRKKKLQKNGLKKFLEKRHSLHTKRKILGKRISELEQKTVHDASSNEALGQLGETVNAKECIERKLCSSYSLGRDMLGLKHDSILPLNSTKYKSHSFRNSREESITVFNTFSGTSSSENGTSSCSGESESCSDCSYGDEMLGTNFQSAAQEAGPSNYADRADQVFQDECVSDIKSTNPHKEEYLMEAMHDKAPSKRMYLKRRRTFPSSKQNI
ncbi:Os01g0605400 [Oryza sativa Japonica Group]|uniref:Os01g0605400 protein n=1 Tax=Oryza sativa subsp. japonica TaxID=39947 RepID=Q0JLE5_ORYSJ|nr:Os01g0605400 [Oryza sativa Japonica Group]|eukprot:NP_001043519.2 Os01g0605400 [Oryza sativa Japonica Group]